MGAAPLVLTAVILVMLFIDKKKANLSSETSGLKGLIGTGTNMQFSSA